MVGGGVRAILLGCALGLCSAGPALAEPRETVLGITQDGSPLTVFSIGSGPQRVVVLGGQHGGPEANTVELAGALLEYYSAAPELLPPNVELDVLPVANPDGLAAGVRQFASGVDPNRNWGGADWQPDAYDSNGVFRIGLGGAVPFSEPETQVLAQWLLAQRPAFVIDYHSAGGFMFGPRDGVAGALSAAYAGASGYAWAGGAGRGERSPLSYSTTGSMNVWLREQGIAGILVELSTPRSVEVERNLAGLRAVLDALTESRLSTP